MDAKEDYRHRLSHLCRSDIWRDIVTAISQVETEALDTLRREGAMAMVEVMVTPQIIDQVRTNIRQLGLDCELEFDPFTPPED